MCRKLYPPARFPNGHPALAESLNNVGALLAMKLGEPAKALPYYKEALAANRHLYPVELFPAGHPLLARSLNNLGRLLSDLGEPAEALRRHEEALAMYLKLSRRDL